MAFNVHENAVFIPKFSTTKNIPTVGGGNPPPPPPTPSPRLVASLPRFGPLLTNPGCTTVTGIAKGHAPMPPLIGGKRNSIRGVGVVYATLHNLPTSNGI